MDVAKVNLSNLCSNLDVFRTAEKYVDVTIQCEGANFQCHRIILALASRFFDTMFGSNFKECTEKSISLPKTSRKTFEDVLQFIYTGDVTITSANALDILEASEFFGLSSDVENLVILFLEKNRMNAQNTLDVFNFVCKTKKQKLISILSNDIAHNLEIVSRKKGFLEIPFKELNDILTFCTSKFATNDDVLLGAITRWIDHHRENRLQYFNKFCRMMKNLNSEWMIYMITNFASEPDFSSLSSKTGELAGFYDIPERSRDEQAKKSLYVFVKYVEENVVRVFELNRDDVLGNTESSFFIREIPFQSNQWMKCIALNEYLYSLHYVRRDWNNSDPSAYKQSFQVSTIVDMDSTLCLRAPPVIFGDVSLCHTQNQIYVYNQTLSQCTPAATTSNSGMFNDEEIGRGIYVYNRELDMWFPVPAMKKKLQNSCMTSLNNRLYLIGGEPVIDTGYKQFAQAYDHREGAWKALPKTTNNYIGADCCSGAHIFHWNESDDRRNVEGRDSVYVCGGVTPAFEEYNVKAGKWNNLTPPPTQKQLHRFTYFLNRLYVMGGVTDDLSIQEFNPLTLNEEEPWTNLSVLAKTVEEIVGTTTGGTILDSVCM